MPLVDLSVRELGLLGNALACVRGVRGDEFGVYMTAALYFERMHPTDKELNALTVKVATPVVESGQATAIEVPIGGHKRSHHDN